MFKTSCFKLKYTVSYLRCQKRSCSMFRRGVRFFFKKNLLITNSITSGGFMAIGDLIQQEIEYHAKILPSRYDWARAGGIPRLLAVQWYKVGTYQTVLLNANLYAIGRTNKCNVGSVWINIIDEGQLHLCFTDNISLFASLQATTIHIDRLGMIELERRMFSVGMLMGPLHHFYYIYLDKLLPKANIKTVVTKIVCDQLFASPATIVCFFYGMGMFERKTISQSTEELREKFKYVYVGDCLFWPPVQFVNFYYLPTEYRVFYINIATMVFNVFLSYMKHYDQH